MKFSLRDLFLVTMIVALAVGWWVDRRLLLNSMAGYQDWLNDAGIQFYAPRPKTKLKSPTSSAPALNPPKQ